MLSEQISISRKTRWQVISVAYRRATIGEGQTTNQNTPVTGPGKKITRRHAGKSRRFKLPKSEN